LGRVGIAVMSLHDPSLGFDQETPDPVWIEECGRRGWAILSGDKGLEKNPINRAAVISAACKVFIFTDTNSKAEVWAAAVIMGRKKIARFVDKFDGPFFAHVGMESNDHIYEPRFHGTGGPKPKPADESPPAEPTSPPIQEELFDPSKQE